MMTAMAGCSTNMALSFPHSPSMTMGVATVHSTAAAPSYATTMMAAVVMIPPTHKPHAQGNDNDNGQNPAAAPCVPSTMVMATMIEGTSLRSVLYIALMYNFRRLN